MKPRGKFALGIIAFQLAMAVAAGTDWEQAASSGLKGSFPNPRPLRATYGFGWNDAVAATADVQFSQKGGHLELDGSGHTTGLVRSLWKFDVHHHATADATTLRPVEMDEVEDARGKTITTSLNFDSKGVVRLRTDTKARKSAKAKRFNYSPLFDMHSALLFVRSQRLADGDTYPLVVYPATNPYLTTLNVVKHESIKVPAGTYKAIKFDIQLSNINKKRELEPFKKFSRANVWISDDQDRILLRVEAKVFVGTVFAELQSLQFQ